MQDFIIGTYFVSLTILFLFGSSGFVMIYYYMKHRNKTPHRPSPLATFPVVTIQLPLYNEFYVIERLIDATCEIDYPRDRLEIQVLDDSTDETVDVVAAGVEHYRRLGFDIKQIRRTNRSGFKAGALKEGLADAKGEFIAIFDADFVLNKDFLMQTLPYFHMDPAIGLVQTRWEHLNSN